LPGLLSYMDSNSQETLKKVMNFKDSETIFDFLDAKPLATLAEHGYLYVEEEGGKFHPFLADEVKEAVKELVENEKFQQATAENLEFSKYLTALIHLYGVYSVDQYVKVWNEHHTEAITEETASAVIARLADWDVQFTFEEELVTSVLFEAEEIDKEGLKRILHVDYYMPTTEDIDYYENYWVDSN